MTLASSSHQRHASTRRAGRTTPLDRGRASTVSHAGGRLPRTIADLAQHHREAKHAIEANLLSSVANGLLSVKESTWVATCYVQQKQRQHGSHWYNDSMSLLQELRQLRRFISDGWERDRFEELIEALQLCIKQQS
ncbi:MAG: hypothetical protein ACKO34_05540 [Vampirovibrionales bacterium]